jgi:hypothetical protein
LYLKLQPVKPENEPFLFAVYASTRVESRALGGWDAAQREAFLRMQFNAQRASYAVQFPNAEYSVIVRDGQDIGRMKTSPATRYCSLTLHSCPSIAVQAPALS